MADMELISKPKSAPPTTATAAMTYTFPMTYILKDSGHQSILSRCLSKKLEVDSQSRKRWGKREVMVAGVIECLYGVLDKKEITPKNCG
jgi:hypothetical protein